MFGKIPRPNIFGNMTQSSHPASQFMSGMVDKMQSGAEKFATRYGNQITEAYDSHVAKGVTKRQNIIKENAIQHKAEHEKWLADRADGMPRDWGTALKDAGGGSGAAFRVGANAVAGGVAGGVIDGSMGNDSWTDGAMTGAILGGALGAGSFAHSVNKLKVGKYTPVVNGGTTVSYAGPHSVNNNTGKFDKANAIQRASSAVPSQGTQP